MNMPFFNQDLRTSQQDFSTYPDNPISIPSYKVNPISQCALRTHVDAALLIAQPEGRFSSDKRQFFTPLSTVVEPPSIIPKKAQASSRTGRPSNAFMIFRSEFVRQNKHIGRRQQELSIMAACAWRSLGTEGQTEWYEKAALAKDKYETKNTEPNATPTRQRQRPYRPRVNARDAVHTETIRPIRETYATVNPSLSGRRKTRKFVDDSLSPTTPTAQDAVRSSTVMTSSALAHALHPPSIVSGHYRGHSSPKIANSSPTSSIQLDSSYGLPNLQLWASAIEMDQFNYVASAPLL